MAHVRKLFGTDGVRGQAGVDLTESLARDLGAAAGRFAGPGRSILIGRDTRESGAALEAALIEGVVAAGAVAVSAGVIPTPGVAVLAREIGAALGCVISASHNPFQDNGIKFLGGDGRKLADDDEARIERLMDDEEGAGRGHAEQLADAGGRYIAWLAATYGDGVQPGFSIGIDCANGAAWAAHRRSSSCWASGSTGSAANPTAVTSTPASAPRTSMRSRRWWRTTASIWGLPSTATPTAAWSWTAAAGRSTEM